MLIAEQIRQRVQEIITHTSHFLSFVTDIHIARHVDIDGIRQAGNTVDDMYAQTLSKARALVRVFEVAVQAVYDDNSSLLLTTQAIPSPDTSLLLTDRASSYSFIESITSSLRLNLPLIRETLEALLSIGYEQAELAQGDYNGSIEWRMSRLSMTTSQFAKIERISQDLSGVDVDEEDVVDFEHAFNRPMPPPKVSRAPVGSIIESTQTLGQSVENINGSVEGHYTTDVSTLVSVSEVNEEDDVDTIDEDCKFFMVDSTWC
jgi:son of sevenless-like protein